MDYYWYLIFFGLGWPETNYLKINKLSEKLEKEISQSNDECVTIH